MVGNSSVPAVTLCVLALHATILTPCNIAAEDASAAVDNNNWDKGRSRRKRHLRRQAHELREHGHDGGVNDHYIRDPSKHQQGRTRNASDSVNDASIQQIKPPAETKRILSSCEWAIDDVHRDGCTNNQDNIDPSYYGPDLRDMLIHPTSKACCDKMFPGGRECKLYPDSRCGDQTQGDLETSLPSCEWAIDDVHRDGCTNNQDNIDPSYFGPDLHDMLIYPTSKACCDKMFPGGRECKIYPDSRCATDSGSSSCISLGWHVDPWSDGTCTDDDNYMEEWLDEKMSAFFFHETAEKCCEAHFKNGSCEINHSGCTPGVQKDGEILFSSCEWAIDNDHMDGCTNNPDNIDPSWLEPDVKDLLIHPTSKACCDKMFPEKECKLYPDTRCVDQSDVSAPSCVSLGWHADLKSDGTCTDDDNYEESWLEKKTRQFFFHETAEKCCSMHFPKRNCEINHSGCIQESKSCISPGWYPEQKNKDGCSNGDTSCCDKFLKGRDCKIYDEGCTIDRGNFVQDVGECGTEWHSDTKTQNGCTNDARDYPSEWEDGDTNKFYPTAQYCCQQYYSHGGTCAVRDSCQGDYITHIEITSSPTTKPTHGPLDCKWHPSNAQNGMGRCDYSDTYPLPWLDFSDKYLFDSHLDCCREGLGLESCGKAVFCETPSPTLSPTTPVTSPPTISPTTGSPTMVLYVKHFSGLCVSNAIEKMPHYIEETYLDFTSCCEASHNKEACLAGAPSHTPTTYSPTITPAPTSWFPTTVTLYYVEHFSGSCLEGNGATIPHYVKTNFTNYWSCCAHSFATEKCLREGPSQHPTNEPSELPSTPPTVPPSYMHSSQPSESTHPTASPTFSYWGAYMSYTSKPTQRPTILDCSDLSWHIDTEADQGCTNYYISPEETKVLLFEAAEECCAILFKGLDCKVRDNCKLADDLIPAELNLPQSMDDCDNYWHPDIQYGRDGCSNSLRFPSSWGQTNNKVSLLFYTHQECCQKLFFDQGNHCKLYNHCTTEPPTNRPTKYQTSPPSPLATEAKHLHQTSNLVSHMLDAFSLCRSAKWHISVGSHEMACSNSLTYPEAWNDSAMSRKFLFDTHFECCSRFFFDDVSSCLKHDDCESEVAATTSSMIESGLSASLEHPGTSCMSAKWHMNEDFTKCSNDFEYPQSWLEYEEKYFSDNPTDCCLKMFSYEDCELDDICLSYDGTQTTTLATMPWSTKNDVSRTSCESGRWHISQDFSKCTNDFEYPQNWLDSEEKYFSDSPTQCCLKMFNYPLCEIDDICGSHLATTTRPPPPSSKATATTSDPTPEPTPNPPNPTNALNHGRDECNGNTRHQCYFDPGCQYDVTSHTCATVLTASQPITQHQFQSDHADGLSYPYGIGTTRETLSPTQKPTPKNVPLQTPDAMGSDLHPCSGKTRRQCANAPGCRYDKTSRTCAAILGASRPITQHQFPSKQIDSGGTFQSTCGGKLKKDCVRDPDCTWDKQHKSCTTLDETADDIDATIKADSCDRRKWHPKSVSDRTCSNSLDYPSLWNDPYFHGQYLFNSFGLCCKTFYDGDCKREDACNVI